MVYLILMLAQPKKQQFMIKHPRIVEPTPRWIRAKFGSIYIADSKKALLLIAYDREFRTRYYFPKEDVKTEFFEESDYKGRDGKYKYWVKVLRSEDLETWQEVMRFEANTFARSFEISDNNIYFGMGSSAAQISPEAGNILRISRVLQN